MDKLLGWGVYVSYVVKIQILRNDRNKGFQGEPLLRVFRLKIMPLKFYLLCR